VLVLESSESVLLGELEESEESVLLGELEESEESLLLLLGLELDDELLSEESVLLDSESVEELTISFFDTIGFVTIGFEMIGFEMMGFVTIGFEMIGFEMIGFVTIFVVGGVSMLGSPLLVTLTVTGLRRPLPPIFMPFPIVIGLEPIGMFLLPLRPEMEGLLPPIVGLAMFY